MILSRRTVLGGATLLAAKAAPIAAQIARTDEVVDLWRGPPPGSRGAAIVRKVNERSKDPAHPDRWITGIARPVMIVRRPAQPNGSAVLLMPGGGYGFLSYDNEGVEQAAWLNARGVTAFILLYRLPGEGWDGRADVPLQDAQRAIRLIRANATRYAVRPDRIAILGFSAGGHLAGSLATRHAEPVYAPVDAADRMSARPDLAGLIYPVVSLDAAFTHGGSRDNLLGPDSGTTDRQAQSVEQRVDAATPPLFLAHAADDGLVPPANSVALWTAMQAARRPVAMHIFEDGGHGFGTRLPAAQSASAWPRLFATFAARQGIFPAPTA
ncbi:alpha/beta hydrolase [Sphingomonas montana]|uniref:alpha/beta hydrolase n=1 Tax=Sphingomonas montana TaxID=1843236 RepID=UPI00096C2B98|nr:alpha/beta hydrolase [Sphingomonas montana]